MVHVNVAVPLLSVEHVPVSPLCAPMTGHSGCGTLLWPAVQGGWRRPNCMYIPFLFFFSSCDWLHPDSMLFMLVYT